MPDGITELDFWQDFYAEAFGWTPQQVAELPPRFMDVNPLIRQAKAKAAKMRENSSGSGPRL